MQNNKNTFFYKPACLFLPTQGGAAGGAAVLGGAAGGARGGAAGAGVEAGLPVLACAWVNVHATQHGGHAGHVHVQGMLPCPLNWCACCTGFTAIYIMCYHQQIIYNSMYGLNKNLLTVSRYDRLSRYHPAGACVVLARGHGGAGRGGVNARRRHGAVGLLLLRSVGGGTKEEQVNTWSTYIEH